MGRLQSADILDGGAGNDTLTAKLNASVTPSINAIETINIEALNASAGLDGSSITGATVVNVTGGGTLAFTNAAKGLSFSMGGDDTSLTIDPAGSGTADDNAVTVDLVSGKLGTLTVAAGTNGADDFDQITLKASGASKVTLTAEPASGSGNFVGTDEKIVVTGASNLELAIANAQLGAGTSGNSTAATIDATGYTGQLTLAMGALDNTNLETGFSKMTNVKAVSASLKGSNKFVGLTSGMEVAVTGANTASTDDLSVAVSGTATTDALTVKLNNPTKGSGVTFDDLTTTSIENVTINSTGTDLVAASGTTVPKNALTTVTTTTANSKLTVTGDKALTVSGSVDNDFTSITVTNTAGVDLTLGSTSTVTVTGGAGNDRIAIAAVSELTAGDSIDGGTGTNTLAIAAVIGGDLTTAQRGYVKNFQTLEYVATQTLSTNGVADLTKLGATTLFLNGALTTDAATKTLAVTLANNGTIKMGASRAASGTAADQFTVTVSGADTAGANSDNLNLQLVDIVDGTGASDGAAAHGGLTVSDVEKVTISLLGDETVPGSSDEVDTYTIANIKDASLNTIVVNSANTGKNADGTLKASDSLTITDATSTIISTVDASNFSGALTITGLDDNYIATGATIKGGSGVNNITGGAGADLITAGKADDILIGGSGKDNISAGAGKDQITGGVGADVLTGGTGRDAFIASLNTDTDAAVNDSTTTSFDVIKDFTVTQKTVVSSGITTTIAGFAASALDFGDNVDLLNVSVLKDGTGSGVSVTNLVTADVASTAAVNITTAYNTANSTSLGELKVWAKNGILSVSGADAASIDTVAEWVSVAAELLKSTTPAIDNIAAFKLAGSTYVYVASATSATAIEGASLFQLEGVDATGVKLIGTSATIDAGTVFML